MNAGFSNQEFCKTARCPSSETLLRYRGHSLTIMQRLTVERHLRNCDFCSAEIQLLQRHRLDAEDAEIAEMPSHLQKLAASLFKQSASLSRMGDFMIRNPVSH
jgi:hypothetical protein